MSETIIIESNREISYKEELTSYQKEAKVSQNYPEFPTYKWNTKIPSGIQLEVGDTIQVEASMIQQKGSPEETIEFSGQNNIKNPFDAVDNKARLSLSYYITNRQQFNCPLPLYNMTIRGSQADGSTPYYGLPDLTTFDGFKNAYPYRGIEGMYNNNGTYTEVQGENGAEGIFSKPPAPIYDSSTIRFYWMNADGRFKAYNTLDTSGELPQYYTTNVELNIDEGFNTPENIAQKITEQFHSRDGSAQSWDFESVVPRTFFLNASGQIETAQSPCITDKCFKTIATSTGDILFGRLEGNWTARIAGEAGGGNEGDGYNNDLGCEFFYKNILCGNPNTWLANIMWMSYRENSYNNTNLPADLSDAGCYTGDQAIVNDIGQWGTFPCLLDVLNIVSNNLAYNYPKDRTTIDTIANTDCLEIESNTVIGTNIFYNVVNVGKFVEIQSLVEQKSDTYTPNTQDTQTNNYNNTYIQMNFGRAEDNLSCGATGNKVNLPSVRCIKQFDLANLPSSYGTLTNGNRAYAGFVGNSQYDNTHNLNVKSRWIDTLDQNSYGRIELKLPTNSIFKFTDDNGNYPSYQYSQEQNVAIIPLFLKNPPAGLNNIPFCGFVNQDNISALVKPNFIKKLIPYPAQGEFFGWSPSMNDNLLSKCVSTQKVLTQGLTTYPSGSSAVNTRVYSYMPYCMIGADNPSMSYDSNSSRMSLTGFHTAVRTGNGVFQEPLAKASEQASIESMCANSTDSAICGTDFQNNKIPYVAIRQTAYPHSIISSQSGISIEEILLQSGEFYGITLDPNIPSVFMGCLFEKLGFTCEQLIPFTGDRQNQFNRGNYNSALGDDVLWNTKRQEMVKPFTTNAYISGSDQIAMVKNVSQQQMENLGGIAENFGVYTNAESDELIALNLPQKLDYPYLVIYSDIVRNTQFYGGANGQQKIPAMAYISRNYSTGDYFYSFSTGWTYTVDTPYILSDFTTQIMLPDGKPAPIEKNSSVVYKITKAKALPPPIPELLPPPTKSGEKEIKEKTKK